MWKCEWMSCRCIQLQATSSLPWYTWKLSGRFSKNSSTNHWLKHWHSKSINLKSVLSVIVNLVSIVLEPNVLMLTNVRVIHVLTWTRFVIILMVLFIVTVKLVIRKEARFGPSKAWSGRIVARKASMSSNFELRTGPRSPNQPAESSTVSGLVKLSELFCEDKNECLGKVLMMHMKWF